MLVERPKDLELLISHFAFTILSISAYALPAGCQISPPILPEPIPEPKTEPLQIPIPIMAPKPEPVALIGLKILKVYLNQISRQSLS